MRYVFLLIFLPALAFADNRPPLSEDSKLQWGLRLVAQAHFLRKNCDRVSLRLWRGLGLMNSLKSRARELGYTEDEMEAYFDDPTEKRRVESIARRDLEAMGADFDEPESFCEIAEVKIASGEGFGYYFRMN